MIELKKNVCWTEEHPPANGGGPYDHDHDDRYYNKQYIDEYYYNKDQTDQRYYSKQYVDENLPKTEDVYKKGEVYSKTESYSKTEIDNSVYKKEEVYPKTETYSKSEVYSKSEIDGQYPNTDEVYTKEQINQGQYLNGLDAIRVWDATSQYKVGEVVAIFNAYEGTSYYKAKEDNVGMNPILYGQLEYGSNVWLDYSALTDDMIVHVVKGTNFTMEPTKIYLLDGPIPTGNPSNPYDRWENILTDTLVITTEDFVPISVSTTATEIPWGPNMEGIDYVKAIYAKEWRDDVEYAAHFLLASQGIIDTGTLITTVPLRTNRFTAADINKRVTGILKYNGKHWLSPGIFDYTSGYRNRLGKPDLNPYTWEKLDIKYNSYLVSTGKIVGKQVEIRPDAAQYNENLFSIYGMEGADPTEPEKMFYISTVGDLFSKTISCTFQSQVFSIQKFNEAVDLFSINGNSNMITIGRTGVVGGGYLQISGNQMMLNNANSLVLKGTNVNLIGDTSLLIGGPDVAIATNKFTVNGPATFSEARIVSAGGKTFKLVVSEAGVLSTALIS